MEIGLRRIVALRSSFSVAIVTAAALLLPCPVLGESLPSPTPEVVLIETDPWAMVIGAEVPSFAMYEDGTIIYRAGADAFMTSRIGTSQREKVLATMRFADKVVEYTVVNASDQPTTKLLLLRGGKVSGASIYGSLRRNESISLIPTSVANAYLILHGYSDPNAKPWLPGKIEVMVWPYEHASDASIIWPRAWLALDDPLTVKRGSSYSIFLSSEHFEELKKFLATRKERGAIEIGGRKWSVSWRLPFPGIN